MTRTMTPWTNRLPRLIDLEDFPRWMTEALTPESGFLTRELEFLPETNVSETEKEVDVTIDLPGMKPEDVKVELRDRVLTISGERKDEKEEKGKTFHRVERRCGSFRRTFTLPSEVDENKVNAKFTDGVLKVTLPKSERTAPKKIDIKH